MKNTILIRGASQNNLKNLDLELPLNQITVITGVSGSGKSSLAFDTVYAEGQRRYVESFSAYARQFLERMDKPRVARIEGIPPSIAINQNNPIKTSRSTLGTLTEINDYLKLLFPRMAVLYCQGCQRPVHKDSADSIAKILLQGFDTIVCIITFPFFIPLSPKISLQELEHSLRQQGFFRIYHNGTIKELSLDVLSAPSSDHINLVVDRLTVSKANLKRILDSLEMAIKFGQGLVTIFFSEKIPSQKFSTALHCPHCNTNYKEPQPNIFSFNNPLGACESCNGFGKTIEIDLDAVIPNPALNLANDAVKPWATPAYREAYYELMAYCKKAKIATHIPFQDLSQRHKDKIINGGEGFFGIRGFFSWLETKTYKMHIRVLLSKYRSYRTCSKCEGTRFKPQTLLYRINGKTIADIYKMSIHQSSQFFESLHLGNMEEDKTAQVLLRAIKGRLEYLKKVGLAYLTLDRQSRTLSGGEVERASLTTALGSALVNTLYVLDEPSIGLHPRDSQRLIGIVKGLRDFGNTILVVEHDPAIMLAGDNILDLGPGAGDQGGRVVFFGKSGDIFKCSHSLTGKYLSGALKIAVPQKRRKPKKRAFIRIKGASQHNLKQINLNIPMRMLVCITGVSGSGKSTLLEDIIYQGLLKTMGRGKQGSQQFALVQAPENLHNVLLMDQSPIGKTPRSNPVTYLKAFDEIRALFAKTTLAKQRKHTPATFSFNVKGGRCEECRGEGFIKIEMQFLADVFVCCPLCRGTRYRPEVLEVTYRGKNIHEVLQMTVAEAGRFFSSSVKIMAPLELLAMVGLGYLRLGQPVNTLSGGESQRLKLAFFIKSGQQGKTLFLFDEPTTGLHFEDIKKLLQVFGVLLDRGHSIIVVEHNLDLIKCADHVIDLGPEGGDHGGRIIAQGPPERIMNSPGSYTGLFLKKHVTGSISPASVPGKQDGQRANRKNGNQIVVAGAREHNLKNATIHIPREKVVVITGLSGSGKSTLAFDILFAEGQRRFLETLSPYARQYIKQLHRPEVDFLKGMPPTVAIEQRLSQGGKKSTVATVTEIYHYLRLLYAKTGVQHCPSCKTLLASQSPQAIADDIVSSFSGKQVTFLAPLVRGRKGFHKEVIEKAKRDGYETMRINGQMVNLHEIFAVNRYQDHQIELVTAALKPSKSNPSPVYREVNRALDLGQGELYVLVPRLPAKLYSTRLYCAACDLSLAEPEPRLFSFNSTQGACSHCKGTGTAITMAPELLAPDKQKSIKQGSIIPLSASLIDTHLKKKILRALENNLQIALDAPLNKLAPQTIQALFYGSRAEKGGAFPGLVTILNQSADGAGKNDWTRYLSQFYNESPCPACCGTRLNPLALAVKIKGFSIADVTKMTPGKALQFLASLANLEKQQKISEPILKELFVRLEFLKKAGLSYLSLDRGADTLSGGETQRIRLAAQLGSNLKGVAYILDEPTIGLHYHDNKNLLKIIRELQEKGNSVIIVEHDEETIRQADFIIDLGIGGGINGGRVVATGTAKQIMQSKNSVTGTYLARKNGKRGSGMPRSLHDCTFATVTGAREHNLKNIDVGFPVGRLSVVTGVSGSGKSTLVKETVYKGIKKYLGVYHGRVGSHTKILGADKFERVTEIDQSPIGKTPRSIPATYVGFYNELRHLFARTSDARLRGFSASRFSFNLSGGRCEKCSGQGKIKVAMSFLPDVYVSCDTCQESRFNEETLQIQLKGKNIAQVLAMTVDEGCEFLQEFPGIYKHMQTLQNMGLGYLMLGQPSPTLSGGEAQRIKIAYELSKTSHGKTLYILDEPTTGLHLADIEKLMVVLQRLVDLGNTMIIIEHNMEVIKQADCIIDLGPGGGEQGGYLVASGPPMEVACNSR